LHSVCEVAAHNKVAVQRSSRCQQENTYARPQQLSCMSEWQDLVRPS
jgi:hypothetical protein